MNIFEIQEKEKTAKRGNGKWYEYGTTGARFELLVLATDQMDAIRKDFKAASEKGEQEVKEVIKKVLDLNLVANWENLTIQTFCEIKQKRFIDFPEERLSELVTYDSQEQVAEQINEMAMKNFSFGSFITESALSRLSDQVEQKNEQKKT